MTRLSKATKKRVKAGTSKVSAADRKLAFVEAYMSNGMNASKAAIAAGYTASGAGQQGHRMLKDPQIMSMIDIRRTEVFANLELSTEKTLREVGRLSFSDPRRLMHEDGRIKLPHELDDDTAAAIASFKVTIDGGIEYKFWDKNSALEKAAKVQGIYLKDNAQKTDGLRDLLGLLGGKVLGVTADPDDE